MKKAYLRIMILSMTSVVLLMCNGLAEQKEKSLILGGYVVKSPQEAIEQTYKDAKWDDLSIEIRLVTMEPQKGFTQMDLNNLKMNQKVYYVSPIAILNIKDIASMDVFYKAWMKDGLGIESYLKKEAQLKFQEYERKHIGEFLGILINGKLKSILKIVVVTENNLLFLGEFDVNEAMDIIQKFFKPLEPAWAYL